MADEKSLMTTIVTNGKTTEKDRFQVMLNRRNGTNLRVWQKPDDNRADRHFCYAIKSLFR